MDHKLVQERSPGLLSQLSRRQEEYRGLIADLKREPDKSFGEAFITNQPDMEEDVLIAVSSVLFELSTDPLREPSPNDVLWSLEFIDHLDTLGFEVRRKFRVLPNSG